MKTNEAFCLTVAKLMALLLADGDREPLSLEARKALTEARVKVDMVLDRDEDRREEAA
jgi:hypothetical protein